MLTNQDYQQGSQHMSLACSWRIDYMRTALNEWLRSQAVSKDPTSYSLGNALCSQDNTYNSDDSTPILEMTGPQLHER